jgi:protein disulfide isomerase family A protein 3
MLRFLQVLFIPVVLCANVLELTDDDFKDKTKTFDCALIMFYAPWCGHCKHLKPFFEEAADKMVKSVPNAKFARLDCTTQTKTCKDMDVSGYPTVKFFKNGVYNKEFDGQRNTESLIQFMKKNCKDPSVEVKTSSELEEILRSPDASEQPVAFAYIRSDGDAFKSAFLEVASKMMDNFVFAHTFVASMFDSSSSNRLRLYRPKVLHNKFEDAVINYEGDFSSSNIEDWLTKNGFGRVGYRSHSNVKYFPKRDLLVLYNNASISSYPTGVKYYRNRLMKVMEQEKEAASKLSFAYSFSDEFYDELDALGYKSPDDLPIVAIYSSGKKYVMGKYSQTAVAEFLKKFASGSLTPHLKSEPIPTKDDGFAKKVVAMTFDQMVNDPSKDVMVVFHAPWCGHCKAFLPKFQTAAEKLQKESKVLLATYDATANDIPDEYSIQGYPTVFFVPRNDKKHPKVYDGARETDDVIRYIAASSTEELDGYDRQGKEKKQEL